MTPWGKVSTISHCIFDVTQTNVPDGQPLTFEFLALGFYLDERQLKIKPFDDAIRLFNLDIWWSWSDTFRLGDCAMGSPGFAYCVGPSALLVLAICFGLSMGWA